MEDTIFLSQQHLMGSFVQPWILLVQMLPFLLGFPQNKAAVSREWQLMRLHWRFHCDICCPEVVLSVEYCWFCFHAFACDDRNDLCHLFSCWFQEISFWWCNDLSECTGIPSNQRGSLCSHGIKLDSSRAVQTWDGTLDAAIDVCWTLKDWIGLNALPICHQLPSQISSCKDRYNESSTHLRLIIHSTTVDRISLGEKRVLLRVVHLERSDCPKIAGVRGICFFEFRNPKLSEKFKFNPPKSEAAVLLVIPVSVISNLFPTKFRSCLCFLFVSE